MERETITINKRVLRNLLHGAYQDREYPSDEYELMYNDITGSDVEDGGADHYVVIKRKIDNRFFSLEYSDWDMFYNFDQDFPEQLSEVFPKQITTTIYE